MKSSIKIALLSSLILFLHACEQDALVEPPEFVKQPVFMCLMTPQSNQITASAAFTKPYYGLQTEEVDYIENAVMVIKDNQSQEVDTFTYTREGEYILFPKNISLKEKNKYTLTVYMPDGKQHFAQATVPPKPDFDKLSISYLNLSSSVVDDWGYEQNPYTIELEYDAKEADRYFVSTRFDGFVYNASGDVIETSIYFSEDVQAMNPNKVSSFVSRSYFYSGFGYEGPWSLDSFSGAIYTMDKAYRDFYTSQYQEEGSPFNEPTMFKSNFSEGALGVFGCYDYRQGSITYPK